MIGVLYLLSQVLGALAAALLVPTLIAFATADVVAGGFLLVAALIGFMAGAIFFALRGRRSNLNRSARFVLVVLVWTVVPLAAAIPIALATGAGYGGALFEAVSGFTTTGASAIASLDAIGPATIFWRAELQWLGGLVTLVTFVAILAPAEIGGLSSRGLTLVGGWGDSGPPGFGPILRDIAVVYTTATAACIILLFATGVPTFDAICLAMSTVSTGGFMPADGDLSRYGSRSAEFVVAMFMLIGASSITWQRMVVEGRGAMLAEHRETYWLVGVALAAAVLYAVALAGAEGPLAAVADGLVSAVSLVSTTGYETRPGGLTAIPDTVVVLLAIVGGSALSTAGGIKLYRVGGMFVQSMHELTRLFFPHSVRSTRFGSQPYDLNLMKAIWASLMAGATVVMGATLLMALSLPSFEAAFVAAVSAFSNIGPLYSAEWAIGADWPPYAEFGGLPRAVMIVTMILGRVEVIVVLAAVNAAHWRS